MSIDNKNRYVVPGLERGLRLLQLFNRQQRTLGAPEIAKALAIPRSTVFRLIQTLEHLDFLERAVDGNYQLGPAVLRVGFEYLASLDLTDLAGPIMQKLRDRTGFAVQLSVRDGREAVVVLKMSPASAFASSVQVGTRFPVHATAYGRALLFAMSLDDLRVLLPDVRLPGASPATPRSVAALSRLIDQDRLRGCVVSESFFERNISAVVAPVHDQNGAVAAAMGITVQQASLDRVLREKLITMVCAAAAELSHRLNYRPAIKAA
ncbi:MAG: IclR family transcriptional regulator [Burkholderiales bacterium]